jgi:hypothetical protein
VPNLLIIDLFREADQARRSLSFLDLQNLPSWILLEKRYVLHEFLKIPRISCEVHTFFNLMHNKPKWKGCKMPRFNWIQSALSTWFGSRWRICRYQPKAHLLSRLYWVLGSRSNPEDTFLIYENNDLLGKNYLMTLIYFIVNTSESGNSHTQIKLDHK